MKEYSISISRVVYVHKYNILANSSVNLAFKHLLKSPNVKRQFKIASSRSHASKQTTWMWAMERINEKNHASTYNDLSKHETLKLSHTKLVKTNNTSVYMYIRRQHVAVFSYTKYSRNHPLIDQLLLRERVITHSPVLLAAYGGSVTLDRSRNCSFWYLTDFGLISKTFVSDAPWRLTHYIRKSLPVTKKL